MLNEQLSASGLITSLRCVPAERPASPLTAAASLTCSLSHCIIQLKTKPTCHEVLAAHRVGTFFRRTDILFPLIFPPREETGNAVTERTGAQWKTGGGAGGGDLQWEMSSYRGSMLCSSSSRGEAKPRLQGGKEHRRLTDRRAASRTFPTATASARNRKSKAAGRRSPGSHVLSNRTATTEQTGRSH